MYYAAYGRMCVQANGDIVYEVDSVKITEDFRVLPYKKTRSPQWGYWPTEGDFFGVKHGFVDKKNRYSFTEKTRVFNDLSARIKNARIDNHVESHYFRGAVQEYADHIDENTHTHTYHNNMSYRYNSRPRRHIHV